MYRLGIVITLFGIYTFTESAKQRPVIGLIPYYYHIPYHSSTGPIHLITSVIQSPVTIFLIEAKYFLHSNSPTLETMTKRFLNHLRLRIRHVLLIQSHQQLEFVLRWRDPQAIIKWLQSRLVKFWLKEKSNLP